MHWTHASREKTHRQCMALMETSRHNKCTEALTRIQSSSQGRQLQENNKDHN